MALSLNTTTKAHAGFGTRVDAITARRQMSVSIGVVAVLALAIALTTAVITPRSGWTHTVSKPLQARADLSFRHALHDGVLSLGS